MSQDSIFDKDSLPALKEQAKLVLNRMREERYGAIYEVIENFIKENPVLVSTAIHIDRKYTVYCTNTLRMANNLANEIAKINHYVEMRTLVPYHSFSVVVENNPFVIFRKLTKFRNAEIIDIISVREVNGFKTLPRELDLIAIYWSLYTIKNADEWDNIKQEEQSLMNIIIGGKEPEKIDIHRLYNILMGIDAVLIGFYGSAYYGTISSNDRLQVISCSIENTLVQVGNILDKFHIKYNVQEQDIKLPIDLRLKRVTIYAAVVNKDVELPIMDIFNSAEYELIPYICHNKIKVGHPYVIAKFLLIDWWICELVRGCEEKQKRILDTIDQIRSHAPTIDLVYGVYDDENTALKKLYGASSFYSYKPGDYYKKHKTYRAV